MLYQEQANTCVVHTTRLACDNIIIMSPCPMKPMGHNPDQAFSRGKFEIQMGLGHWVTPWAPTWPPVGPHQPLSLMKDQHHTWVPETIDCWQHVLGWQRGLQSDHPSAPIPPPPTVINNWFLTWVPETIDWNPDPHNLFTAWAGVATGAPIRIPTCLGRYAPSLEA